MNAIQESKKEIVSKSSGELKCPTCDKPLQHVLIGRKVFIWCGFGPCKSYAAHAGAEGEDNASAMALLESAIDSERLTSGCS